MEKGTVETDWYVGLRSRAKLRSFRLYVISDRHFMTLDTQLDTPVGGLSWLTLLKTKLYDPKPSQNLVGTKKEKT